MAGLLAATATLRADLAMLVLAGVPLALLCTGDAGGFAKLQRLPQYHFVRAGAPRRERPDGGAYVRAVQVQANALP